MVHRFPFPSCFESIACRTGKPPTYEGRGP